MTIFFWKLFRSKNKLNMSARCIFNPKVNTHIPNVISCTSMGYGAPLENTRGGWVLSKDKCYLLDFTLAKQVSRCLPPKSTIIDIGAGLGCYTNTMRHFGVNVTLAFDFARDIEKLTNQNIKFWDASVPFPLSYQPDWTFSIEVAEHVPVDGTDGFMTNVAMGSCGTILSWAPKNQEGGVGHINTRSLNKVTELMRSKNLTIHNYYSRILKHHTAYSHIKRNINVFVKNPLPSRCQWKC